MGQKINPIGFRLGVLNGWRSNWFSQRDFAGFLDEDRAVRDHITRKLSHAGRQRLAHRLDRAQAAAVLHRHVRAGDDPPQVIDRDRLAGLGAVEVDDVKEARARLHPGLRGRRRIVVVDRLRLEAAVREPHRLAAADVDRRVEDHATTGAPAKLRSSASPSSEDFSGWNCAPMTFPRSTSDTNRSPYSPRPMTSRSSSGRQAKLCTW